MKSYEAKAKTREEAVALGLAELGVSLADVDIEVVDEGKKGVLGILGNRPCVVRLTVKEEDSSGDVLSLLGNRTNALPQKSESAPKAEKSEAAPKAEKKPKAEKTEKPAPRVKKPAVEEPKAEEAPKAEIPAAVKTDFAPDSDEAKAYEFLKKLTSLMGVEVTMNLHRDEEGNLRVDMFGDTLGILIGRRGETLDALQYLTSLYVNRGREEYLRVTLDNENYRSKREEALRRLANRMANRAVKTGRKVVMEPMNPYERRILHSALQQNEAVTTHSEGEGEHRHVVITLKQQGEKE